MFKHSDPLLLIPARGGSKGLLRKNILPLAGKPLIAWTIEAALKSRVAGKVIISTDDPEIRAVSSELGGQAPFLRPAALASDSADSLGVVAHALSWFAEKENWHPEWIILLQPTSPLRTAADIFSAFKLAKDSGADAVVGVTEPALHPYLARTVTPEGKLTWLIPQAANAKRRQDYPNACAINGAIYIIRTEVLIKEGVFQPLNTVPYWMPRERSVDIDSSVDFRLAEILMGHAND